MQPNLGCIFFDTKRKKINIFALQFWTDSWCNGSTTVFGAVCQGSNPCEST